MEARSGAAWQGLGLGIATVGSGTVRGASPLAVLFCRVESIPSSLISLQLAPAPMVVFAIGIELAPMMAVDRLHHSHLGEDHRTTVLRGARHQMNGRLHLLHFVF